MWRPPSLLQTNDKSKLSIYIPSTNMEEYLARWNFSPDTLRIMLSPSPPRYPSYGFSTPEPHKSPPKCSTPPPRESVVGFYPDSDPKTTHDQETQTDKIPEVKVSPPKPTYEIKQMEGYLIINGVRYIPEPPPPLQHTVGTQTDKPLEIKAIDVLKTSKIPDLNPFATFKADKIPTFKPIAILKTDKIPDSQPAAKVEKAPESKPTAAFSTKKASSLKPAASFKNEEASNLKPAAAFQDEKVSDPKSATFLEFQKASKPTLSIPPDVRKTLESKPVAAKIEEALNHLPTPPDSLYRTHSMPSKLPSLSIDPPKRFDMKLSGEGSNSDDEFTDI